MLVRDFAEGQEIDRCWRSATAARAGRPDGLDRGRPGAGLRPGRRRPREAARRGRAGWSCASCAPPSADEYALDDLLDGPHRGADAAWRPTCASWWPRCRTRTCARCWTRVFGPDAPTWAAFRDAPAAKRYHQAYRHGLLEHSLSVAQAVSAISATFPGIDRDVAVTGALLHDIGKLEAYTADPLAIDMTDLGKLQGEIPLGYYRIRRLIEDLPGFPTELAAAVLHIILSHHGTLEHGSPVVPCTREATLVHMIDNLGGRLGSFDRLEKELPDGSRWSPFDRALGGGAWFAGRQAA